MMGLQVAHSTICIFILLRSGNLDPEETTSHGFPKLNTLALLVPMGKGGGRGSEYTAAKASCTSRIREGGTTTKAF